jgi:RNA polymerase sigma-B factor
LSHLPGRERDIVNLRSVGGLTQSEIASQIGVSQMHVSRLLSASLAKRREAFASET